MPMLELMDLNSTHATIAGPTLGGFDRAATDSTSLAGAAEASR
jgi:hypothetical protein